MMLAKRSSATATSGLRRVKPRTYPSTSRQSFAHPVRGGVDAVVSSVKIAGSAGPAP